MADPDTSLDATVQVRDLPSILALSLSVEGGAETLGVAAEELLEKVAAIGIGPLGPLIVRLEPGADLGDDRVRIVLAVGITRTVEAPQGFDVLRMAERRAACLVVVGSPAVQRIMEGELRAWLIGRGLLPAGPWEMAFLGGSGAEHTVELRIFVREPEGPCEI